MNKFIKNSSLYLITALILNASTFLLLPLYTRLLSPKDYGNIYLMQTISIIISMVSSVQINASISRYYYEYKGNINEVKKMYSSIVMFTFYITTFVYATIFIFNKYLFFFLEVDFYPYMGTALLTSYLAIFYNLILSLLYVEEKANKISITSIFIGIISVALTIILVINCEDKLFAFLVSKLIIAFIQFIIFICFSKPYFKFEIRLFNIKEFYDYSIQRLPMGLSSWIVTFADRFMVYGFIGAYENGVYSTGYKLGQIPEMIFQSINKAYVPYVFDKYSILNDENKKKIINIAQYLFSLYVVATFGIIVFSKEIVYLLDESYRNSLTIMVIIVLSYLLNGIKLLFHCPMDYKKEYGKIKSAIWMFSAFINIFLNAVLIPKHGIYGAAYATFISYFVTLVPILYFSNKAMKFKYNYKVMVKVLTVSLVYMSLIVLKISFISLLIKLVLSLSYIYIIVKLNNLKIKDLKNVILLK